MRADRPSKRVGDGHPAMTSPARRQTSPLGAEEPDGVKDRALRGVAQAGEEAVDALEQGGGLLVERAGGGEDAVGEEARLLGGTACPGDVERDLAGAGGGLLDVAGDLARRR